MPEDEKVVAVAAPCGACRTLRRRCVPGCVFAPYFSAEDFAAVHGVFGASNATKMLEGIEHPEQRRDAAATLIEEARARARDPTFGPVSYLRILQEVNDKARKQVEDAREEIAREFGALAASQPVDVAAAAPAARVEARAQVDAALKHAREQDARLREVRNANEVRWRELHQQAGTGKHAGNGKGPDVVKRHRGPSTSERTMLMPRAAKKRRSPRPPGFPDERERQQMAAAEAERGKALVMRQAAPAKQQQMLEASREEAMRSLQAPAAAGQHDGTGQPRHAGDDAAGRTPGQGSTSVLLEAMMQLAGAREPCGEQQQQQQNLVAQHAQKELDISKEMQRVYELLDMARNQQIMKNDVMTEMGQWDAAAGGAMEQDVTMTTQQIPNASWQHHQYPAPQYAEMRAWPQEMPQQMEQASASTAELAQTTTGNMSQQFAWAQQQQYHDPAAVHHASPWHHQMAEAHQQPAAASVSQVVASEQDMLLLLQQRQVAAAAESLSAGGARQFDNHAPQYDDTELTLGYGHPDMHQQQQVVAAGQVAGVQQDMNSQHAAAAVLAEREMMQLAAGAQHQQQHDQKGLGIALGNCHPDAETQALLQQLAAILEHGGKQETIRKQSQSVTTGMGQWDAAAGMAREQDVMTMTQQSPDDVWLLETLERIEKASTPRPEITSRQAEARHAQKELGTPRENGHPDGSSSSSTQGILQEQELLERKLEMLMRRFAAAGRAREQELIAQQAAAAQGHAHPDGSQGILQAQELLDRKLEMLMRKVAAAGREQLLIAQQAAAAQQQHPVAQYSGTELDTSLGQGHGGHPYWHQPTAQQMLQEKQLPTVQQMLQEQQLADAVGFGGHHQPNTAWAAQQVANGEHGGGAGATMAFLSPGSAKDAPFLADQQPQPNGHQMDSSLLPLPPSLGLGQLHAQASHQQRTDGGGQGLNSDLAAYLHYESLSRHGLAGNGRLQQG